MADSRKVVLLGKSGSGKSSLANTIFGETTFRVNHSSNSKSQFSKAQTRMVNGLNLTLIDTPGIFNMDRTDEEVNCEIYSCLIQCAPGPHVFLLILLVEKFTEQEEAIIDQIKLHFGEDVFRYTIVVFTHGDQLQEGTKITEFVDQCKGLKDLIHKCGGRCHVIDNKYWKSSEDPYRSNSIQVGKILNSIQMIVEENSSSFFTNKMLVEVEQKIQNEQNARHKAQALSLEESREQAKIRVLEKYIFKQKVWRYVKRIGLPIVTVLLILPVVFSYFRGRSVNGRAPGVKDALPSSVMKVVQEVAAPIKTTLDYFIQAIFMRETYPPNKTQNFIE